MNRQSWFVNRQSWFVDRKKIEQPSLLTSLICEAEFCYENDTHKAINLW
jgi:hypothetical protein